MTSRRDIMRAGAGLAAILAAGGSPSVIVRYHMGLGGSGFGNIHLLGVSQQVA